MSLLLSFVVILLKVSVAHFCQPFTSFFSLSQFSTLVWIGRIVERQTSILFCSVCFGSSRLWVQIPLQLNLLFVSFKTQLNANDHPNATEIVFCCCCFSAKINILQSCFTRNSVFAVFRYMMLLWEIKEIIIVIIIIINIAKIHSTSDKMLSVISPLITFCVQISPRQTLLFILSRSID